MRMTLGFFLLPVVDTAAAFFIHGIVWPVGPPAGGRWGDPVDAALSFASGVAIVSVFITFGLAVPVVSWLASRGRLSFGPVFAAAVAAGNLPIVLVSGGVILAYVLGAATPADVRRVLFDAPLGIFRGTAVGSALGALSGLVFCAVAGIATRDT